MTKKHSLSSVVRTPLNTEALHAFGKLYRYVVNTDEMFLYIPDEYVTDGVERSLPLIPAVIHSLVLASAHDKC